MFLLLCTKEKRYLLQFFLELLNVNAKVGFFKSKFWGCIEFGLRWFLWVNMSAIRPGVALFSYILSFQVIHLLFHILTLIIMNPFFGGSCWFWSNVIDSCKQNWWLNNFMSVFFFAINLSEVDNPTLLLVLKWYMVGHNRRTRCIALLRQRAIVQSKFDDITALL